MTESSDIKYIDIKFFIKTVELAKKDGSTIFNRGKEYATVLIYNLFSITNKKLYILSNSLSNIVTNYNGYRRELEKCLSRGVEVKILLEEDIDRGSKTYEFLKNYLSKGESKNLEIRKVNSHAVKYLMEHFNGNVPNFIVSENSYRVESDKVILKATGKLNLDVNNITLKYLLEHYEKTFSISDEYVI